ncbi:hypothetical protein ABDF71_21565 [Ochrobactrum sp. WV_118_8]
MSIEEALKANTEALNRNSELLEFLTSKARDGLTGKDESTKPAKASAKETEEKKPASRSRSTKAPKAPSAKDMSEATTNFLDVDDEGEYKDRRDLVKQIVDKFGVKKMSEIEEEDRQTALDFLDTYKNGDDPFAEDARKDDDLA